MSLNATLSALAHAVSGSAGTAVSTAAVFPLDLVTTRLKAQRMMRSSEHYRGIVDALRAIVRNEGGISALYNGLAPDVAKSVLDSFLFFGFYSYLRGRNRHPTVVQELAMGALAGACSRALTTPISTVVTRMQISSQPKPLRQALAEVYQEMGALGLWSGYSATLFLTLNPSLTFFVNRRLAKRILPALQEEDIPVAWVAFLLAAFSKATATALTYPFQTGRLHLQMATDTAKDGEAEEAKSTKSNTSRHVPSPHFRNIFDKTVIGIIIQIIRKQGHRALYDGLRGELLKGFLSHGLTMLVKGFFLRLAVRLWILARPHLRRRLQSK